MNADTVRELLSSATPGEWEYRPHKHDDWGVVRGPDGYLMAKAWNGAGVYDSSAESDPFEGNARLIAAAPAVAQWGLEQAQEVARLREAWALLRAHFVQTPSGDLAFVTSREAREAFAALEGTS